MKCHHMFAKLAKFKKSDLTLLKKKEEEQQVELHTGTIILENSSAVS